MKLEAKELSDEVEIDMSPMIDMVFLLLIFFIVASQVVSDKPPVEVPTAESAAIAADEKDRFMISVSKNEDPLKKYYLPYDAHHPVPFEKLVSAVQDAVNANPDVRIVVRADNEVPFKETEKIMKACAEAGAYNMIFSAFEEKQ